MARTSGELAALLERVGGGDGDAFEALYRATSRKMYGIVVTILVSRAVADEVLQDVYVRVWQHAAEFRPERASAITWMAAIARNRALDEARRGSRARAETLDEAEEVAADLVDPLAERERSDAYRAVMRCLNRLEPERRDLVLLAYYRGLSRDALARRYNHPTATIKTWLHRSLAQLKQCLAA